MDLLTFRIIPSRWIVSIGCDSCNHFGIVPAFRYATGRAVWRGGAEDVACLVKRLGGILYDTRNVIKSILFKIFLNKNFFMKIYYDVI